MNFNKERFEDIVNNMVDNISEGFNSDCDNEE